MWGVFVPLNVKNINIDDTTGTAHGHRPATWRRPVTQLIILNSSTEQASIAASLCVKELSKYWINCMVSVTSMAGVWLSQRRTCVFNISFETENKPQKSSARIWSNVSTEQKEKKRETKRKHCDRTKVFARSAHLHVTLTNEYVRSTYRSRLVERTSCTTLCSSATYCT